MGEARDRKLRAAETFASTATDPLIAGQWVVAFLDILGYRSLLKSASTEFLKDSDKRRTPADSKANLERAIRIRRSFIRRADEFMDTILGSTASMPSEIDESNREAFAAMWSNMALKSSRFSDTLLLYTSLAASNLGPMTSLYGMLLGCSVLQVIQLARGAADINDTLPLRGAIDVDFGIPIADYLEDEKLPASRVKAEPELYSAALTQAYELEQTEAEYPRVIVSEQFRVMLQTYINRPDADGPKAKSQQHIANSANQFLHQDLDGAYFVDFIGPAVREIAKAGVLRADVAGAWAYVKKAANFHREQRNFRLARKYIWLADYMAPRLKAWDIPI